MWRNRLLNQAKNGVVHWSFRRNSIACESPHASKANLSREQKNEIVFAILESAEEQWQSPHQQKSPQWAQQINVTNEKDRYSEYYKNILYAGPKSARNVLINIKCEPNPKPGLTRKCRPDLQLCYGIQQSSLQRAYPTVHFKFLGFNQSRTTGFTHESAA